MVQLEFDFTPKKKEKYIDFLGVKIKVDKCDIPISIDMVCEQQLTIKLPPSVNWISVKI
jgi:hypothetical protein